MGNELIDIEGTFKIITDKTKGDRIIWASVALLALVSMLVVYSATGSLAYKMNHGNTEYYLFKQIVFIILGFVAIYFLHRINYAFYSRLALVFYIISIPLLIYTLFFGAEINEGSRWIKLPIINMTFQTSDFAKLALFMFVSRQLSRNQKVIKDFKKGFLPILIPIGITCMLIFPANLSNGLLTGATSLLLMYIGRARVKHILLVVLVACIPIALLIGSAVLHHKAESNNNDLNIAQVDTNENGVFKRFETWRSRVENFIYTNDDEVPYQVRQAKIAIANGSILYGLGPGNSRQRNYLPQAYNDFIFSIIIEEYGLLGGAFVIFIYLIFLFRCIRIFRKCPYAFGAFLALGLSFTLIIQALANLAVNVNIMPVTGVTLPLISMGGSSFLFTCVSIGIILSVACNVQKMEGEAQVKVVEDIEKEKQIVTAS